MSPPDAAPPASALAENGRRKIDLPTKEITHKDSNEAAPVQPFVDRFGHLHSAAIFDNWNPAVIRALGIRRVKPESPEGSVA